MSEFHFEFQIVCLFHGLEKNCQRYFLLCDGGIFGETSKSPSYDGPIGIKFKNGLKLEDIVDFEPIPGFVKEFPQDFIKSLNKDLQLLYELCIALQKGPAFFSEALAKRIPGKIHKAR